MRKTEEEWDQIATFGVLTLLWVIVIAGTVMVVASCIWLCHWLLVVHW